MLKKILTLTLAFVMLSVAVFSYGELALNAAYATTTGLPAVIAVDANNSDVTEEGLTGSVTLNIASETAYDDAIVVTAVFDGTAFLTAKVDSVDLSATEENKPVIALPAAAPTESGEYNVKFFLWESKTTLAPIAEPISTVAEHVETVTVWNGGASTTAPAHIDGVYQITTAEELAWFGQNAQTTDNAILVNNLYMNSENAEEPNNWAEFRIGTSDAPYAGVFDGNDKTIYNLYIEADDDAIGFFGVTRGATIKDLTLADANVVSAKSASTVGFNTGVLTAVADDAIIDRVVLSGQMSTKRAANGGDIYMLTAGSIAGTTKGQTTITNCTSTVDIIATGHDEVKGSASSNYGVGGLVGFAGQGTSSDSYTTLIDKCSYNGTINVPYYRQVGGAVGRINQRQHLTIKSTTVAGSLTAYVQGTKGSSTYDPDCKLLGNKASTVSHCKVTYGKDAEANNYSDLTTSYTSN